MLSVLFVGLVMLFRKVESLASEKVTVQLIIATVQQLLRWATVPEQSEPKSGGCCAPFSGGAGSQLT